MRILWRSILSAVLLVTLAQSTPLRKSSVQNGSDRSIPPDTKENGYPLPKNVQPNSYTIKLEPHLLENDFTFNGESNIDVIINGPATKTIVLHAVDLEIEEEFTSLLTLDGRTTLKPTKQSLDTVKEFLTIEFADPIATGAYTLNLRYTGNLKEDPKGFYRSQRQIHGRYVWEALTEFKPSYARRAFPCFDETAMKARFRIFIKRPENYVGNSTALGVKRTDDGDKSWIQFKSSGLVSTDDIDFKVAVDANSSWWGSSTTQEIPESTTQEIHESTTQEIHESTTQEIHESTTQEIHESTTQEIHESTTQEIHESTTQEIHESTTQEIHESTTQEIHESTTQEIHESTTQEIHESTTQEIHESTTEEIPESTTQEIHESTTQEIIASPIPPTNQKCIHATYSFKCTQCRPIINISLS